MVILTLLFVDEVEGELVHPSKGGNRLLIVKQSRQVAKAVRRLLRKLFLLILQFDNSSVTVSPMSFGRL